MKIKSKKGNNENKSYIYLRFTVFIFVFFFILLLLVAIIICLILLTPFGPLLLRGGASLTIITVVAVYLSSAILSSFLSYFFGRKFLRCLVDLSNVSKRVAQGDFSVRVKEVDNVLELENVVSSFNQMVEELSKVETLSNEFVSNVSHEFKSPLAVIRSNVNILQNTPLTEDEKNICLKRINEATDKLSTLISNVLKISKLDNESIKLEKKVFRLDESLRKAILELSDKLEEKEIELDLDLDDCLICSDEELLNQVWTNIIYNAIKFSNEKGIIHISLKARQTIKIIIRDEGIGMTDETKHHIFDRFYQGETSHSKEGNGLGLTIVSKIVKLLNGSIIVESALNEGSAFMIEFNKNIQIKE